MPHCRYGILFFGIVQVTRHQWSERIIKTSDSVENVTEAQLGFNEYSALSLWLKITTTTQY